MQISCVALQHTALAAAATVSTRKFGDYPQRVHPLHINAYHNKNVVVNSLIENVNYDYVAVGTPLCIVFCFLDGGMKEL